MDESRGGLPLPPKDTMTRRQHLKQAGLVGAAATIAALHLGRIVRGVNTEYNAQQVTEHHRASVEFANVPKTSVQLQEVQQVPVAENIWHPKKHEVAYKANTAIVSAGESGMTIYLMTGEEKPGELSDTDIILDVPGMTMNEQFYKDVKPYQHFQKQAKDVLALPDGDPDANREVLAYTFDFNPSAFPEHFQNRGIQLLTTRRSPRSNHSQGPSELTRIKYDLPPVASFEQTP